MNRWQKSIIAIVLGFMSACVDRDWPDRYDRFTAMPEVTESSDDPVSWHTAPAVVEWLEANSYDIPTEVTTFVALPWLSFTATRNLLIEELSADNSLARVTVVYPISDGYDGWNMTMTSTLLHPRMSITVNAVSDHDEMLRQIADFTEPQPPIMVTMNGKTYLRSLVPGLVNTTTYFLYRNGYLITVVMNGFPAQLQDSAIELDLNQAYLLVVKSLDLQIPE